MQQKMIVPSLHQQTDLARKAGETIAGLTERTERQKASYKITFVYHRRRHRPDYDVDADVDERTDSQGHDKEQDQDQEQEQEQEQERDWSDDDARERTTKRVTAFCIR
uniref:GG17858 n=1 Tax=Drosophila erecta TaxID=7220 RepID=B3NZJ9_DROER